MFKYNKLKKQYKSNKLKQDQANRYDKLKEQLNLL
jgi:hypothetical protein